MRDGHWNRWLGWGLLVVGFAMGVVLDPWSLAERDAAALPGSPRMLLRHAQAVVVAMGFLQLLLAHLLRTLPTPAPARKAVALLSVGGALGYATGYLVQLPIPTSLWLTPVGALLNATAFAVLFAFGSTPAGKGELRLLFLLFCFGMALDAVMGLFVAAPDWFFPSYLGPEEGVRLRMLRLARAAVIALSVLAWLYQAFPDQGTRLARWGGLALVAGALGMPLILAAAAFTWLDLKYLLVLPALATFLGVLAGAWLAWRSGRAFEAGGWSVIAASIAAGLLMGLYAFDGPVPTPGWVGDYNAYARRLIRLGHAYAIVFGLLLILLARARSESWPRRIGVAILLVGSLTTLVGIGLLVPLNLPTPVLGVGPALVTAGLLLTLTASPRSA